MESWIQNKKYLSNNSVFVISIYVIFFKTSTFIFWNYLFELKRPFEIIWEIIVSIKITNWMSPHCTFSLCTFTNYANYTQLLIFLSSETLLNYSETSPPFTHAFLTPTLSTLSIWSPWWLVVTKPEVGNPRVPAEICALWWLPAGKECLRYLSA